MLSPTQTNRLGQALDAIHEHFVPLYQVEGLFYAMVVEFKFDDHDTVYSRISALLRESPLPSFHYVFDQVGNCRYLKAQYGTCDPACAEGEICTAKSECIVNPKSVSGGILTIEGLGAPIGIEAEDYSAGPYNGPAGLPSDLFAAGDPVGAVLSGGAYPAESLGAEGVSVMDHALTDNGLEMVDGEDAQITWTPGPDPNAERNRVV